MENYPRKWSKFYNETPWDDMYNPNNQSKHLRENSKLDGELMQTIQMDEFDDKQSCIPYYRCQSIPTHN